MKKKLLIVTDVMTIGGGEKVIVNTLNAIKNIKYLYELGEQMYRKKKIKKSFINFMTEISVI
ncbi:hypothetical protein bcgnr5372_55340 [Bacillus luti]